MSLQKKILLIWVAMVGVLLASLAFPHEVFLKTGFVSYSLQLLLLIISLYLVKYESTKKTRYIFVNFAAFFAISIFFHIYNFVGTVWFAGQPMARIYYFQFISAGLYFFLLALAICYITVDVLFRDFKTYQKYLISFAIAGGFFAYYYHPYFQNPDYIYSTKEIAEFREVDRIASKHIAGNASLPSQAQLLELLSPANAELLSKLSAGERASRVAELYPYLEGTNYKTLLFKPIYLNTIYMSVLCLGLILLFFGYLYKKDPPQGAYIEKMMFLFLIFCTLEIFHAWSFIKTIEWQSSLNLVEVGQVLSAVVLGFIAMFLALRLKFITSIRGEFYEHEIVESPFKVTRWRDALDNLVIAHFFNRQKLIGRLFVDPNVKN